MSAADGIVATLAERGIDARALPIVDAHHHFWDTASTTDSWPWITDHVVEDFFLGDYSGMRRTFLPAEHRAETAGWNIVGTVHCEAERSRSQQVRESAWLTELHEQDARYPLAIVGHVSFLQPDRDEVLAGHAALPLVKGIRSKPIIARGPGESVAGQPGSLQDPAWLEGLARLADFGFSWDLRVPWYHLAEAAEVVAGIPDTTVIVNHCGLPLDRGDAGMRTWRAGMEALAALPNTVVKVSELGLPGNVWDRPSNIRVVRETLEVFGFDRALFASNMPVAVITAPDFDEVMAAVLTGADQAARALAATADGATAAQLGSLFSGTATRAYRLDPTP